MNNQRKFILVAVAVGIIAVFLPWMSISVGMLGESMTQSVNGFRGVGILYFLALAATGVVAIMGNQQALLDKNMRLGAIGGGAVAIIALVIYFADAKGSTGDVGGFGLASASIGYGFYLSAVAAIAVTAIPFVIKGVGESFAGDIAQLKSSMQTIQSNISTPAPVVNDTPPPAVKSDRMAELEKLIAWRDEGKITEQEFEDLKSKLL